MQRRFKDRSRKRNGPFDGRKTVFRAPVRFYGGGQKRFSKASSKRLSLSAALKQSLNANVKKKKETPRKPESDVKLGGIRVDRPEPKRTLKRSRTYGIVAGCCAAAVVLFLGFGPMQLFGNLAEAAPADQSPKEVNPSVAVSSETSAPPVKTPDPTPEPTPDPTLTEGMESDEVNRLQERLMSLGYLDIDESTRYYGPATAYAVSMFQRQHGLEQDGVCGPKTLEIIYTDAARPYTLLEGTQGNDVDMLQSRLMELGYLSKATGYYGTETVDAVMAFQARNSLAVDGKTGAQTLDCIYSADALPTEELMMQVQRQGTIDSFLASARAQLGKPYVWGAAGPSSFDCSGLVTYALRQAGSSTGRLNAAGFSQNSSWQKITDMNNMEPGDLIFYYNNARSKVGHVGIYVGDGMMVDASSSNGKIVERSCRTPYWESHFVCARRPW